MPDREKVLKGMECCINFGDCQKQCDYFPDHGCDIELMHDALELLKAHEPRGEWKELKVDCMVNCIDEWQSARCSACGKYHTTPYLYYFKSYNYCPNCGAKMDGERRE